jgi:DNA-binding MarR family transcriptional regulator
VLQLLSDGTSHGMSDAADYAMLPAPSLTKAVDQLVSAKLIDRRADPQDRRRVLIHLTARGRRRRQQLADRLHPVTTLGAVLDGADVASLSLDPPIHEWGRCFLTQAGCRGVPAVAVVTAGRRMWLVRAACWWLRGRVIPSPP